MNAFRRFEQWDAGVTARRRVGQRLVERRQLCPSVRDILSSLEPGVIEESVVGGSGGNRVRPAGQKF